MGLISLVIIISVFVIAVVWLFIVGDGMLNARRRAKRSEVQDADIPDYGTPDE